MVYLIGGSPRAGKSTVTRSLAKKLDIGYMSTDNVRPIVMPFYKGAIKNEKFPFEKIFNASKIDEYYKKYSRLEILKSDLVEAQTIWPGVKSFIDYLLVCKMNYIVEGFHLLPKFMNIYKNNKNVKIICLIKSDQEKIYNGLLKNKNTKHNDWLVDNARSDKTLRLASESLSDYGKYFIKESEKFGFKYINTENDFLKKLKSVEKLFV